MMLRSAAQSYVCGLVVSAAAVALGWFALLGMLQHPDRLLLLKRRRVLDRLAARSRLRVRAWVDVAPVLYRRFWIWPIVDGNLERAPATEKFEFGN